MGIRELHPEYGINEICRSVLKGNGRSDAKGIEDIIGLLTPGMRNVLQTLVQCDDSDKAFCLARSEDLADLFSASLINNVKFESNEPVTFGLTEMGKAVCDSLRKELQEAQR